jgi:hypothetical protein
MSSWSSGGRLILNEHNDAVEELRARARRAYEERVQHEMDVILFDPQDTEAQARKIAVNDLGRRTIVSAELPGGVRLTMQR